MLRRRRAIAQDRQPGAFAGVAFRGRYRTLALDGSAGCSQKFSWGGWGEEVIKVRGALPRTAVVNKRAGRQCRRSMSSLAGVDAAVVKPSASVRRRAAAYFHIGRTVPVVTISATTPGGALTSSTSRSGQKLAWSD